MILYMENKIPAYNHTRGDSELIPCDICRTQLAEKYNFEKFIGNGSGFRFVGITKRKESMLVTSSLTKLLDCDTVSIHLDKKNNLIMLKPAHVDEKFTYKMSARTNGSKQINVREKDMPTGRYYFEDKIGDGFMCRYKREI